MHKYFSGCCVIAIVVTHMVCKILKQNRALRKSSLMGHVQNIRPVNICAYTERILTMHGDIYEMFCVNVRHLGLS